MKIKQCLLTTFTIGQFLLVGCISVDQVGEGIVNSVSSFVNYIKHVHNRYFPMYPTANRDSWPLKIENYDFIIVGAGPSGAALANRLSENPNWRILLLEAGEEPAFPVDIPVACSFISFSEYNWWYRTEKQDGFCRGCRNKSVFWPSGKGLGGSTLINYMMYVRGNKKDFQKWYNMGNPGWSYEEVLPYFLKSEDAHIAIQDEGYHNRGGNVKVSDVPFRSEAVKVWIEAAQQAGYPYVDYNGKQQYGVSYLQSTSSHGQRWSAERAYLRPIRHRRNLTIRVNALVTKVLINNNNVAYGVEYMKNGRTRKVFANKEVILSAGALKSPHILMLSGVGPKWHLEDLGIRVVKDLPVGAQMYDHAMFPGVSFLVNESITISVENRLSNPKTYLDYFLNATGPFTLMGGVESQLYIKTEASEDPDPKYPDVELLFIPAAIEADFGLFFRRLFNIPKAMYNRIWKPLEGKYTIMVIPMLADPASKGSIRLRSRNPLQAPLFYANYLSDSENKDVRAFISAIRIIQEVLAMPAFQRYDAKIVDTPMPGCEQFKFDTDEYWECALRTLIASLWHQVATCKMGPPNDPEAVVDNELRVYGVDRLRVVDIGVIPLPLKAHTSAAAYVIGEKAADYIKSTWQGNP